jgi:hypothetical protein
MVGLRTQLIEAGGLVRPLFNCASHASFVCWIYQNRQASDSTSSSLVPDIHLSSPLPTLYLASACIDHLSAPTHSDKCQ